MCVCCQSVFGVSPGVLFADKLATVLLLEIALFYLIQIGIGIQLGCKSHNKLHLSIDLGIIFTRRLRYLCEPNLSLIALNKITNFAKRIPVPKHSAHIV